MARAGAKYLSLFFWRVFRFYGSNFGTRNAEVLSSLIMKITANENDTNDILQTFR